MCGNWSDSVVTINYRANRSSYRPDKDTVDVQIDLMPMKQIRT